MFSKKYSILILLAIQVACSTTSANKEESAGVNEVDNLERKVSTQKRDLLSKQKELDKLYRKLDLKNESGSGNESYTSGEGSLLPPNAKSGECYARAWTKPEYKTITENYVAQEVSEKLSVKPAEYQWVEEQVLVKEASVELVSVPAKYEEKVEELILSAAVKEWRIQPWVSASLANKGLLDAAQRGGVNLEDANANTCYHEHYLKPKYENVKELTLVTEESENLVAISPVYETVEKRVIVKEASTRIELVPAVYESQEKEVIDVPAHSVWKKGTGPIQKMDESTGEIVCLIDVPDTYKTIAYRVLISPAVSKVVEIPAEYKVIKVKKLVSAASEERSLVPAAYEMITKRKSVKDGVFVWHNVNDKSLGKDTRTGSQICLVEEPAKYQTLKKQVVVKKAGYLRSEIPAQYENVKVRKLVKNAQELRTVVPEVKQSVSHQELVKEAKMEWRSILCETNMTKVRLKEIQLALNVRGYNPGKIDGVIGKDTMKAVNNFQKDENLPIDQYLNTQTLDSLGVSSK